MGFWSTLFGVKREAEPPRPSVRERILATGRLPAGDGRPAVEWSMSMNAGPPEGYVSPYLSAVEQAELLKLDEDGLPNLRLEQFRGELWLAETSTGRLVNAGSRELKRLGVLSVRVRGDEYAPGTLRHGRAELRREPDNEHDQNAVAIYQHGVRCGYWNKGGARAVSKLLESGADLVAFAVSSSPPKVIAADERTMRHLLASVGLTLN